jgi:hypothetical protein
MRDVDATQTKRGAWNGRAGRSQKGEQVMSNKSRTKANLQQRVGSLIAGTQKHAPTGQLTFGGATYDATALVQLLQNLDNAITASDAAKAKWNDALKSQQDEQAKVGPVIQAYQSYLESLLGNAPSTLADYGLAPRKVRTPLTVEQKAAAVAKRAATRAARHTMGTVQKKGIKGDVKSVVVTPVSVSSSSAASPAARASAQTASPTGSAPHTA